MDISEEMLSIARQKAPAATYLIADAEHLPFPDDTFDAATCAFGVRNFVHLERGLNEMQRVLKPCGRLAILELATPDCAIIKPFYNLYTRHIIPRLGQMLAGNREAYTYLPESIARFPKGDNFLRILNNSNYEVSLDHRNLTLCVCRLYTVQKTEKQRGC
ncbi:MAG: ubiquinone/menaquinone biosynthesis methyltransferase [Bacteroidales bacterium]|nr:ubiquinone/menaquinone biosynthesis methyltransferase [Bacteroidales bacterium]